MTVSPATDRPDIQGTEVNPIQHKLLLPLTTVLLLLTVLVAVLLWHQQNQHLQENLGDKIQDVSDRFEELQSQQIALMSALLEQIATQSDIRSALQARDRERLLELSHAAFEAMRREQGIGHFYFHDAERNNILRVQFPDKLGGHIDRYTLREAERTGNTVGGLEFGTYNLLTLRVAKPVFSGTRLIGYIELGRDIESLLNSLHRNDHGIEVAVTLHKGGLQREAWETGMQLTHNKGEWDRFPQDVVAYTSHSPLPEELMAGHLKNYDPQVHGKTDLPEIRAAGRTWRVGYVPLLDAEGQDIGDLAIMLDHTAESHSFNKLLLQTGIAVASIVLLLLAFIYRLLKKTDQDLLTQQKHISRVETQRQAIFNVAKDGIILIDENGIIQLCNPEIENIFGYKTGELVGSNIKKLMPEPYHSNHDNYLSNYHRTGQTRIMGAGREVPGRRKDGSVFPLELAVTEAVIENRKQFVGILRDISLRKQAEEELIQAKDAAEQASQAKTAFLSSMSHELRTPLNSILGFGQLLEYHPGLDARAREWAHEIINGGQILLMLVNDVLDLARIESEQLAISISSIELEPLVENCFHLLGPLAEKKQIQLSYSIAEHTQVRADPDRLKQVLINLLSNGIKYNREQGSVRVECEQLGTQFMRISIIDTGRGIPRDKFEALFQPFNRLGEEGGAIEGTGIGLTIALRIIELMGGMIGVESEVGVGSRFWIDLPRTS